MKAREPELFWAFCIVRSVMPQKKVIVTFIVSFFACLSPFAECCAQSAPILYNRSEFNKSVKYYRTRADSGDLDGYLNLAVILKDLGHYRQGIRVLKNAAVRFPKEARILKLLARFYFLNGEPHKAVDVLQGFVRGGGQDVDALLLLGLCFEIIGRDTDADGYLRRALERDPDNVIAHLTLADIYYRSGRLKESDAQYKAVNLLDASIQHIYSYWGVVLVKLGNYHEAYKIYEKMRGRDPSDPIVLAQLEMIRAKLGESFFAHEKEKRLARKRSKKVFVKPADIPATVPRVRVGLVDAAAEAELAVSTACTIRSKQGGFLISKGSPGQVYSVSATADNKLVCQFGGGERVIVDEPVVFEPDTGRGACTVFGVMVGKDSFWRRNDDRSYRGMIEVSAHGSTVRLVNVLSMEEYLYSVVPSEMPSTWPFEALKAQAVAARSEAMHKLGRHKADGYDFCSDVHCQAYSGVERETAATTLAVDETRGMVLYADGRPIDAVYSSCCGGHTQDNIFGREPRTIPYFKGTPDMVPPEETFPLSPAGLESWLKDPPAGIFCNIPEFARSSNFRWVRIYTAAEMDAFAARLGDVGRVSKIVITKRNPSGHIAALKLIGSRSSYLIEKELNIRKALGDLRSSMFKVEARYDRDQNPLQFVFYGGGWGHGVGMCQAGACGLAQKGKSYKDILVHYFKAAELKKMY